MSAFISRLPQGEGLRKLSIPSRMFRFIREFGVLALPAGKSVTLSTGSSEFGLNILSGSCDITVNGKTYANLGERKDVFSGLPTGAYVPRDTEFTVTSRGGVEVAVCQSHCEKKTEFAVISPKDVRVMQVGKDNWHREVRMILPDSSPAENLLLGETYNPPGNWSGTPPHRHETDNAPHESLHEELYYFRTRRPDAFGLQRFYSPERGVEELIPLRNDSVTYIPWGYHQIAAGAGYDLHYVFFISGLGKKAINYVDPDYKWILGN